ncbi:sensor histidine kinase [Thermohalobacter berrensis]|uniref:histidine kinase n=1 Tax=Thermohalobacter berrensis TaxID=99594 RepID=A0A419SV19_9FIRM|nr:HAMP domain-containing sensor histidine kinase [Thermohalobacter berrensis]RKD29069.1 hypothetical protein BET03_05845 [Thermohalobacter berrensis]
MIKIKKKNLILYYIGILSTFFLLINEYLRYNKFLTLNIIANMINFLIFIYLAYYQIKQNKLLKKLVITSNKILKGNFNTKIYIKGSKIFSEFGKIINDFSETLARNAEKQKIVEESRKKLLSNISHDLRTPLTSIIGYIDALKDGVAVNEKERKEYLDIVSYKAKNLKKLIDEIFYMAKLDSDDIPLNFKSYDLGEILRECIIEFLPQINKNNIALKVNIPDEKMLVYVDKLSLNRVISNLINNSLTYGGKGKVLGIDVISLDKEYKVTIWDKGPGIANEHLPYIFDRLYITDISRNNQSKRSGLGLAIVKKLLEKHEGKIWANSIPYEKTEFIFTLPKF